jgi:hypothetical protein
MKTQTLLIGILATLLALFVQAWFIQICVNYLIEAKVLTFIEGNITLGHALVFRFLISQFTVDTGKWGKEEPDSSRTINDSVALLKALGVVSVKQPRNQNDEEVNDNDSK